MKEYIVIMKIQVYSMNTILLGILQFLKLVLSRQKKCFNLIVNSMKIKRGPISINDV